MPWYIVKGLGGGFDGLLVQGSADLLKHTVHVEKILDRDTVVGDRNSSLTLPPGGLFVGVQFVEETADPGTVEYASDNPYGALRFEGKMTLDGLEVSYAQHEKVLQVSVHDTAARKTVFSQNYLKDFDDVRETLEAVMKESSDVEDLVFRLQQLKERETDG